MVQYTYISFIHRYNIPISLSYIGMIYLSLFHVHAILPTHSLSLSNWQVPYCTTFCLFFNSRNIWERERLFPVLSFIVVVVVTCFKDKSCQIYLPRQRTLTVGISIIAVVQLVSGLQDLIWPKKEYLLLFVCSEAAESKFVKLVTSHAVILPPTVSVLWPRHQDLKFAIHKGILMAGVDSTRSKT